MVGINTGVPLYQQLKEAFPNEIVAVNAMYTHGLVYEELALFRYRIRKYA